MVSERGYNGHDAEGVQELADVVLLHVHDDAVQSLHHLLDGFSTFLL